MSYINDTYSIPKFGGTIYYVSDAGLDTNSGATPDGPLKTIGAAIGKLIAGDAISIKAGTYTEVGLDLDVNSCELWFEIGVIIAPATGTALTISGNYCLTKGMHQINAVAGEIGKLVSGNGCHVEHGKILGGAIGLKITGTGVMVNNYASGSQTSIAYDIQGIQSRLQSCKTVGIGASYGYKISGGVDTGVLSDCTCVGHETSGYYIDTGSSNWTIVDCSSGGGDGKWRDIDDTNVWSGFTFPETKYKEITLDNSHLYNLFQITGAVEILEIYGHVTTQLAGANTNCYWQLFSATSNDNMTKITDTDMGAAVVGSVVMKTENPGKAALFYDGAGVAVDKGVDPKKKAVTLNAHNDEDTFIRWMCAGDNDTSGVMHFHVVWRPLTDDGFLEAV